MTRMLVLLAVLGACSNTAPPPADGVVAPAELRKRALAGGSKWEGKKIKITGMVIGTGGLLLDVGGVSCLLAKDADPALIGKTVTAEGTVKLQKLRSGSGVSLGVELADCTATEH